MVTVSMVVVGAILLSDGRLELKQNGDSKHNSTVWSHGCRPVNSRGMVFSAQSVPNDSVSKTWRGP
jgi:hypothetical protein